MADSWLNPALNAADYRPTYDREGVVQIEGLFPREVAEALERVLQTATPWSLVHADEAGRHVMLDPQALAGLAPEDLRERIGRVTAQASSAFSYLYFVYPMIDAYLDGRDGSHP